MMDVILITIFPEMLNALNVGMPEQAQKKGCLRISVINPRDFTEDNYRRVDDRPYGGGPGMVMMAEPLAKAIETAKQKFGAAAKVIYLSPKGKVLQQQAVKEFSQQDKLILLAGRYEGIDERIICSLIDEEWSIGDYVLSGGELPALVLIDAISRLLPGVLNDPASSEQDSFSDGLLDCPHYTRPEVFCGQHVPEVLLSGNHQAIARWRRKQQLGFTKQRRPDLLAKIKLSDTDQQLLDEYLAEQ